MHPKDSYIISGSHYWVRSGQILPDHNLVSLVDRRGEQMKAFMFKIVNKQLPEYQSKCVFFNIDVVRGYNLWGTQLNIFIPRTITEALRRSFDTRVQFYGPSICRRLAGH